MQLAEGQKSKDVKHFMHLATPLRPPREMAEGVESLEKNAHIEFFGGQLAEGVFASLPTWRHRWQSSRRV
jgi:hypothetical protein